MILQSRVFSITLVALSLFTTVAMTSYPKTSEVRLLDALLNHENYSAKARPVLDHQELVNVTVQVQLNALIDFNERREIITSASWIHMLWKDERLSWNPTDFGNLYTLQLDPNDIWTPSIFITNSLDNDVLKTVSPDRGSIHLFASGDVYYGTPLIVSTQCSMQIRYFPFDTQACPIIMTPERLNVKLEEASYPSTITSLEWNLLNTTMQFYEPESYNTPVFCFVLRRDPKYYIATIIMPSTAMCFVALSTFLAPPDCGERLSLGISMVLGLTVFQLLIADSLPTSSKQTPILSNFLSLNFHIACLTVPFSLVSINLVHRDTPLKLLQHPGMREVFLNILARCLAVQSRVVRRLKDETKTLPDAKTKDKGRVGSAKVQPAVVQAEAWVQPNTVSAHEDQIAQMKSEHRTMALVIDRVFFIGFVFVFFIVGMKTLLDFNTTGNFTCDVCGI